MKRTKQHTPQTLSPERIAGMKLAQDRINAIRGILGEYAKTIATLAKEARTLQSLIRQLAA